jgi:hypothetical protein
MLKARSPSLPRARQRVGIIRDGVEAHWVALCFAQAQAEGFPHERTKADAQFLGHFPHRKGAPVFAQEIYVLLIVPEDEAADTAA